MITKNKHFEAMIKSGWRPSYNGEYLDLYNGRSNGRMATTILTTVNSRNEHLIIIER